MMLRIYDLKDPRDSHIEEVYEYPKCLWPKSVKRHARDKCLTVSKKPMGFPIMIVPEAYLTERENQRQNTDFVCYLTEDLANYYYDLDENVGPEAKFNRFIAKIVIQLVQPNPYRKENEAICALLDASEKYLKDFQNFLKTSFDKKFPWSYIKDTVEKFYESYYQITYTELMELFPCEVMSDKDELEKICEAVLKENQKSVEDYRKGKKNSINHLKGQVMKLTKGKANPMVVNIILERKLNT